jgi:hypothetical protein
MNINDPNSPNFENKMLHLISLSYLIYSQNLAKVFVWMITTVVTLQIGWGRGEVTLDKLNFSNAIKLFNLSYQ